MSRLHLAALAADVARSHVPAALLKNIDLGFESDVPDDRIDGDEVLLKEALNNLIDNALKYCPENVCVTVRVRSAEGDRPTRPRG